MALPYHRVLFKDGSLSRAFIQNGKNLQYTLLKKEGVTFTRDRKVKMQQHLWPAKKLEEKLFFETQF